MEQSGHHLHLVFSEDGDDPLVLESSWKGLPAREAPNLTQVRAKVSLRALSIMLVMAKYREAQPNAFKGGLLFQVKDITFKKGTWICTIANDFQTVVAWVKKHFRIPDSELFVWACPGSTHNEGGKKTPLVLYDPKKLPLANLHLWIKPAGLPRREARLLHPDELLPFALKLEAAHWKMSAIKELCSAGFGGNETGNSAAQAPAASDTNDALFLAYRASAEMLEENSTGLALKSHLDWTLRVLLEKEFERYREQCDPFFAYVESPLGTMKSYYLWQPRVWNRRQIALLRDNCIYYSRQSDFYCGLFSCNRNYLFGENPKFSIWREIPDSSHIGKPPSLIFNELADSVDLPGIDFQRDEVWRNLPLVMEEAKEAIRTLSKGYGTGYKPVMLGTFFVQQIILIDFLNEICLPFSSPEPYGMPDEIRNLHRTIYHLKREAVDNRDMFRDLCNNRKEFFDAANAGMLLLRAQSAFWSALHRKLLTLE